MKKCRLTQEEVMGTCQAKKDGWLCNRIEKHKGKHHAHAYEECQIKWN